jgi:hypothetical protein
MFDNASQLIGAYLILLHYIYLTLLVKPEYFPYTHLTDQCKLPEDLRLYSAESALARNLKN